jgi:hypothetical protein
VPEVSVETVTRLLVARGADLRSDDGELLAAARAPRHRLAATLLSLWELDGRVLTSAQRAELAAYRERLEAYRATWRSLSKAAPDAFVLKGSGIAVLYPDGVLRSADDLEVVCTTSDDLWAAARALLDDGWQVASFTVHAARPGDSLIEQTAPDQTARCHVLMKITRPGPDAASGDELSVTLTTAEMVTDPSRSPYQLARPPRAPLATHLVALAAELWGREPRSRDLLDLALLVEQLDADDLKALRDELNRTGLRPEWQTLTDAVADVGRPLPVVLPETPGVALRERMARRVRAAARWSHPVRALAYAAQFGVERESALADRASGLLHERIGVYRALLLGLPLFGVPLDGDAAGTRVAQRPPGALGLEFVRIGRSLVVLSPIGSYLLAAGAHRQEWIDQVVDGVR